MLPVKILIVEDELLIAQDLASRLTKASYLISGNVSSAADATLSVERDLPDIVIMDINLRGAKDGIDCALNIQEKHLLPVIFLTDIDNPKTIKRASEVRFSTYLVKPYSERQLLVSIRQAILNGGSLMLEDDDDEPVVPRTQVILTDSLFIRLEGFHFKKIHLQDILFLKAAGAYAIIQLTNGESHTFSLNLNKLHLRLSNPSFVRVSKSIVVNISKIDELNGNSLLVANKEIPIGEKYKSHLLRALPLLK